MRTRPGAWPNAQQFWLRAGRRGFQWRRLHRSGGWHSTRDREQSERGRTSGYNLRLGFGSIGLPPSRPMLASRSPISGSPQQNGHFGASLSAWNFGRNEIGSIFGVPVVRTTADLAIGSPNYVVSG